MSRSTKLVLDIVMGAVVPILILNRLSGPLGAPLAYVFAALVPVAWVAVDLLFLTRQFNAITAAAGLTAVGSGLLAFWFVDGLQFALKDSVGLVLYVLLLGGSVIIGRPFMAPLFAQAMGVTAPDSRRGLDELLREPSIFRTLARGTLLVAAMSAVLAAINVILNLNIVIAAFGTEEFNQQVAQVNAITRVTFPLATMAAFAVAMFFVYRAVYAHLPHEPNKPWYEADLPELLRQRAVDGEAEP